MDHTDKRFAKDGEQYSIFDATSLHNGKSGAATIDPELEPEKEKRHTHKNSILSNRALDRSARNQKIMAVYNESIAALTDRQVMERLGYMDLNMVRPRITELLGAGYLHEVDNIQDAFSGRMVRRVTISGRLNHV